MINGRGYSWESVTVSLPGLEMQVQSIDYDDELEKELKYGTGNTPRGYGTGNYKGNSKITVLREDFDDLLDYCKSKSIPLFRLEIPKIIVSYANDDDVTRTDVINKVSIAKIADKPKQGDKSMTVDLDLLVAGLIVRDGVQPV
ncbi:hypothetical protein [Dielma fastidiosa]|uniref:Phage tail protein n=1 Tax=Dielma fastidiosa TaxID=1034346 RepID=A0AB35URA1_9FIRM|nr:hypothetical protein [Dielma fastidiosa]MDY5168604.1 hypothetical protein [Dielma fastidiosa]